MVPYIIRRILQTFLLVWLVSLVIFFAMRLLPGDPILMSLTKQQLGAISMDQVENIRHELGLDRLLVVQYGDWIIDVFSGDLGDSLINRSPVIDDIIKRVPISSHIAILALILMNIVGIPAGIIAAIRRGGWLDTTVTSIANIGITIPVFWLGILLIYFFGLQLKWLPLYGYVSPLDDLWLSTKSIIMPVICLSVPLISSVARLTRSSMLEVMRQDYIRTAWSKGLVERIVIFKHALKNGLIPIVTLQGVSISQIIGGSVIVEAVFSIPGMGRLAMDGIFAQDYPIVQAVILIAAFVILISNLVVDISYAWIDPRIRYE